VFAKISQTFTKQIAKLVLALKRPFREIIVPTRFLIEYSIMFTERIALQQGQ